MTTDSFDRQEIRDLVRTGLYGAMPATGIGFGPCGTTTA